MGLAGTLGGLAVGALLRGYQIKSGVEAAVRPMVGGGGGRAMFGGYGAMRRYGYGPQESAGMRVAAMRQTLMGRKGAELLPTQLAMGQRAEFGTVLQTMGTVARTRGGTEQSKQAKFVIDAVSKGTAAGLRRVQVDEYLQNVNQLVDQQRRISLGAGQPGFMTQLMTGFMKKGGLGVSPDLAANLASQTMNMVMGHIRDPMFLRVMAQYGAPGRGYLATQKMVQRGITGEDPRAMMEMAKNLKRMTLNSSTMELYLQEMSNLTPKEAEEARKIWEGIADGTVDISEAQTKLKDLSKTESQNIKEMADKAGDQLKNLQSIAGLDLKLYNTADKTSDIINDLRDTAGDALVAIVENTAKMLSAINDLVFGGKTPEVAAAQKKTQEIAGAESVYDVALKGISGPHPTARQIDTYREARKKLTALQPQGKAALMAAATKYKMSPADVLHHAFTGKLGPGAEEFKEAAINLDTKISEIKRRLDFPAPAFLGALPSPIHVDVNVTTSKDSAVNAAVKKGNGVTHTKTQPESPNPAPPPEKPASFTRWGNVG